MDLLGAPGPVPDITDTVDGLTPVWDSLCQAWHSTNLMAMVEIDTMHPKVIHETKVEVGV